MSEARVSFSLNGVDLTTVVNLASRIDANPDVARELSAYARRVRVRWVDGFHSQAYTRDVPSHTYDEPAWLGGKNRAMAASEAVLGAIGGCIATGFAANAALREVPVHELEIEVEGTINLPSFFGILDGNPGYTRIQVTIYARCDADPKLLDEIAFRAVQLSPVVNTVKNPVDVQYTLRRMT